MEDGSKLQQLVELPKGGADHPLSNQEIADKFENLCASVMEEGCSDQIRDLVLGLEAQTDMRRLIGLLTGPVKNALAEAPKIQETLELLRRRFDDNIKPKGKLNPASPLPAISERRGLRPRGDH
jgi:hypothetical protein